MLDYRANKLFVLLFGLPLFLLTWLFIIGKPIAAYVVSYGYLKPSVVGFLGAIVCLFVLEIVLLPIATLLDKSIWFIFSLFVDVIPADGRSKAEAEMVVRGGSRALVALQLARRPSEWDEDLVEKAVKLDWVQRLFYRERITDRLNFVRRRFSELALDDPNYPFSWAHAERLISEGELAPTWVEKVVCSKTNRLMIYPYLILLYLLIANPFGYG